MSAAMAWAVPGRHSVLFDSFEGLPHPKPVDTVPVWAKAQRPIAVLRLDGDWYESTMLCLEHLWPLVSLVRRASESEDAEAATE
jgi:hypothetical protein